MPGASRANDASFLTARRLLLAGECSKGCDRYVADAGYGRCVPFRPKPCEDGSHCMVETINPCDSAFADCDQDYEYLGAKDVLNIETILDGVLPPGPAEKTVPTFDLSTSVPELQGDPIYVGTVLKLTSGNAGYEVRLALHINGFQFYQTGGSSTRYTRMWCPFTLLEQCDTNSTFTQSVFSLTEFHAGRQVDLFFATFGPDSLIQRTMLTRIIVDILGNVTRSIFPVHSIAVKPVRGQYGTDTRIMAGYLCVQGDLESEKAVASIYYCELRAYLSGQAQMALYKDEWCAYQVNVVTIDRDVMIGTCDGAYCTTFAVENRYYCARTTAEKEVWMRAITNVKVKLMFSAPDPTAEDLHIIRDAVQERAATIPIFEPHQQMPILNEIERQPLPRPFGDLFANPSDDDEPSDLRRLSSKAEVWPV